MPRDDAIKPAVVAALLKDGWTITADPLQLRYEEVGVGIDLGAERLVGAARGGERIAVEIKTFAGVSTIREYRDAWGQFDVYRMILEETEPDRKLYLAVAADVHRDVFGLRAVQMFLRKRPMARVVVRTDTEEVVEWIG